MLTQCFVWCVTVCNTTNQCPKFSFHHRHIFAKFCLAKGGSIWTYSFPLQWKTRLSSELFLLSGLGFYLIILYKLNPTKIAKLHSWIFNFKKYGYPSLFPLSLWYPRPTRLQQTPKRLRHTLYTDKILTLSRKGHRYAHQGTVIYRYTIGG